MDAEPDRFFSCKKLCSQRPLPTRALGKKNWAVLPLASLSILPVRWRMRSTGSIYLTFTGFGLWNVCVFLIPTFFWAHFQTKTLIGGSAMSSDPLPRFNRYLQPMGLLLRESILIATCSMLHSWYAIFRRGPLPPDQLQLVEQNYEEYREKYDRH